MSIITSTVCKVTKLCWLNAIVDNANFGIQEDQHEESQDVETTVASYLEQETSPPHDFLQFSEMVWQVMHQVLGICEGCLCPQY